MFFVPPILSDPLTSLLGNRYIRYIRCILRTRRARQLGNEVALDMREEMMMAEEQLDEAASSAPRRFRLVALDIDGTLLDPNGQITPRTEAAIAVTRAAGVIVTLVTGRRWSITSTIAERLGLSDPLIVCDGAVIRSYPAGDAIYESLLAPETAQEAATLLADAGLPVVAQYIDPTNSLQEYLIAQEAPAHPEWLAGYLSFYERQTTFVPLESLCLGRPSALRLATFGPLELLRQVAERLTALNCGTEVIHQGNYGSAELTVYAERVSKGAGLVWLARYLGIAMEETLAIGDSANDISMLRAAGLGVAMGNAVPEVYAVAGAFTASNAEDGVAQALERYILEPLGNSGYPIDALAAPRVNTV